MKTVRLQGGSVFEIIPPNALPVAQWYGTAFAADCMDAPDDVQQGYVYDPETGTFAPPVPPMPTQADQIAALKAKLTATDYKAIKYAEGWITEAEYAPIKAERQGLRDEINRLEGLL